MRKPVGAPPKWELVEDLQAAIDGYFAKWNNLLVDDPKLKKTPNIFGLCLFADMSYDTFCNIENGQYDKTNPEFGKAVKKAKLRLLDWNAEHALSHTAGMVFNTVNLTRKMEEPWKNAQSNELSGPNGGRIQVEGFKIEFVDSAIEKPKG